MAPKLKYGISGSGRQCVTPAVSCRVDSQKVQEPAASVNASDEEILHQFPGDDFSVKSAERLALTVPGQDWYFQIPPTIVRSTSILSSSEGSVLNGS
jgi:hypothetical protein